MNQVAVTQQIDAPIDAVWARYTDHVSWTEWAGLGTVRLEREGSPTPNGVGCVRAISSAGVTVFEEVVSFEAPRRMTYRLVKGLVPLKDHFGEVEFEPRDGGTRVTWRCQFNSKIPGAGPLLQLFITRMFRKALYGLREDLGRQAA